MALEELLPLAVGAYDYISGQEEARDITEPMQEAYGAGISYTQGAFDPYIASGQTALTDWSNLLADPSTITDDPGYQFGLEQGQQALERSAAAGGDLLSGQTLLDVNKWGQDYGQTYYDQALARQADLAKTGLTAGTSAAPLVTDLYAKEAEGAVTRELLQQMNQDQLIEGLLTPGTEGTSLLDTAADAVGGGLSWVGDQVSGLFGGEFGDDLSNLVSGSVFDPDTWGDLFGGGGDWDFDLGEAFWDGMGEVADFFQ